MKSLHLSRAVLIWTLWNSSLSSGYLLIWPRVKIIWQEQHWGQVPPLLAFILSNYQEHPCTMEWLLILISPSLLIAIFSPSSFVFQNPMHQDWKAGYWGKRIVLWAVGKCSPKATAFLFLFFTCVFGGSFCQRWAVYLCCWPGARGSNVSFLSPCPTEKPVSLTYRCPCRFYESNVARANIKHLKILSTPNCSLQIV